MTNFTSDDIAVFVSKIVFNVGAILVADMARRASEDEVDHRTLPRSKRLKYDSDGAKHCIYRDFLGSCPLFGSTFRFFFRISMSRFEILMQDVMKADLPFYRVNRRGSACLEARLLLPLKTLASGAAVHNYCDYFSMSFQMATECCKKFDLAILQLYGKDFLRVPTADDLKRIVKLHKHVHGVPGMAGCLDCTHVVWKNCPMGWQAQYKGKEKVPSIALEAVCDYNLFFWHVSFGYAGTLNDKSIIALSPFVDRLIDGSFIALEKDSGTVPYKIAGEKFDQLFFLVDGIYDARSRWVKTFGQPITNKQDSYRKWQESARKDIERAFGVLKAQWQFLARPVQLWDISDISTRVFTCLCLHNMIVSERVMGDPRLPYHADTFVEKGEMDATTWVALKKSDRTTNVERNIGTNVYNQRRLPKYNGGKLMSELLDEDEFVRLRDALMKHINRISK
ncbi:MAG: transposase family protein [Bacteroidota bacterium]